MNGAAAARTLRAFTATACMCARRQTYTLRRCGRIHLFGWLERGAQQAGGPPPPQQRASHWTVNTEPGEAAAVFLWRRVL